MRFVVTGEWRQNQLLRLILAAFLVYVALLWATNAALFFTHMSLSYDAVVEHYRGNESKFLQPRSLKVLLEVSHFHLFAMGVLILTMTHLVLFAPISVAAKTWLVVLSFVSALLDETSSWLIRYVHPGFAYAKMAGFVGLQATLAAMLAIVGWAVAASPPNGYRDGGMATGARVPGTTAPSVADEKD
jgi:hypothetical protein